jgi:glycosyltransferase involved in cell wall biosynthesis
MPEKHAQSAYGPNGIVLAQSYDSGKTWKSTKAGIEYAKAKHVQKTFTRRIMAVVDVVTPSTARRIQTPFSVMHEADISAGWAPFVEFKAMADQSLDGIICPGLVTEEELQELKRVGRSVLLDIDAPLIWSEENKNLLLETIGLYDGVTVPNTTFASRLRAYHDRVFVTQHTLQGPLWKEAPGKETHDKIVIAVPESYDQTLDDAFELLQNYFGDKVEFRPFNWFDYMPGEEVLFYTDVDVVVLPPPHEHVQFSYAPVLPAMAGGCVVVGDVHWPGIKHMQTGMHIGRHITKQWAQYLRTAIEDSRVRQRIGRNAHQFASRHTADRMVGHLALPYRLLIPEGSQATIR